MKKLKLEFLKLLSRRFGVKVLAPYVYNALPTGDKTSLIIKVKDEATLRIFLNETGLYGTSLSGGRYLLMVPMYRYVSIFTELMDRYGIEIDYSQRFILDNIKPLEDGEVEMVLTSDSIDDIRAACSLYEIDAILLIGTKLYGVVTEDEYRDLFTFAIKNESNIDIMGMECNLS